MTASVNSSLVSFGAGFLFTGTQSGTRMEDRRSVPDAQSLVGTLMIASAGVAIPFVGGRSYTAIRVGLLEGTSVPPSERYSAQSGVDFSAGTYGGFTALMRSRTKNCCEQ